MFVPEVDLCISNDDASSSTPSMMMGMHNHKTSKSDKLIWKLLLKREDDDDAGPLEYREALNRIFEGRHTTTRSDEKENQERKEEDEGKAFSSESDKM